MKCGVKTPSEWEIFDGTSIRGSQQCLPGDQSAGRASFHAFSYTVRSESNSAPSLVIAGSGEAPEGQGSYQERCVRRGDVSPEGLREKAHFVLGEMERRLGAFGAQWRDTTAVQVYTVHDLYPFLADEIVRRGAAEGGLTWCFCRPPVVDLDFEMDCRAISNERVV
jgi:hypothetical protein